ncbi:MAG: GNAT family N-acetyltransferase [Rhodospirillales bacterium]|nr:GNAT family N-acetyltransferase [Rhodospirillales bacterium]MBT4005555.1 GNAT family N-acetyltransferase [Rhodospirillales bacterium]MBT5076303.1 GNAT family N-acetyltransferase [Rhodospirillales bacterium]MBT5112274.1 GNAT family N-acetyltransferase [Rhodospirillales bacterium]MBT5671975.1 GNAT family N-acetyltransferase [Rhodospirillales bacterium]
MTTESQREAESKRTAVKGPYSGVLRAGDLEVRLARNEAEIRASQNLRYRVFYGEMTAHPSDDMVREERDFDDFDPLCDHLLVIDHSGSSNAEGMVVGTYRLIRRPVAEKLGQFYSATEFDIANITALKGEILELGRSCVAPEHRTRPAMQLLWEGIAAYVFHYDIEIMFGCASLPGTDIQALAEPLSYLYHFHLAPKPYRPRARAERHINMDMVKPESMNARRVMASLPPLIKGYLRLGGFIGDGAVVDEQFNTTDVCIVVKTNLVTKKYFRHFERTARLVDEGAEEGKAGDVSRNAGGA